MGNPWFSSYAFSNKSIFSVQNLQDNQTVIDLKILVANDLGNSFARLDRQGGYLQPTLYRESTLPWGSFSSENFGFGQTIKQ